MYTLEFCTSITGIVTHYTGCGCQSLTPRKYAVLNGNIVLNLCDIFQEHNPELKRDLLVISSKIITTKINNVGVLKGTKINSRTGKRKVGRTVKQMA
jgi:hypothetical protein